MTLSTVYLGKAEEKDGKKNRKRYCKTGKSMIKYFVSWGNSPPSWKIQPVKEINIYETRYRRISEFFIYQYCSIIVNISHISKLFRYVNPCTSMQFHGRLVRNWCGGFGICHTRKWVHHDITFQNTQPCNNVFCTLLQGCVYFAFS